MRPLLLFILFIALYALMGLPTKKQLRHINQINEFHPTLGPSAGWDRQLIAIDKARRFLKARKTIVVAVIDTGMDLTHPLLQDKVWSNPGETGIDSHGHNKANNGIDDDKNGFIDDVHGWNFVDQNKNVLDTHGHGTHVAGIIAQLAPEVKILPLKYFDQNSNGEEHMINTIRAIEYARKMGVHIINYSAGGLSTNAAEEAAIDRAARQSILFVAAAGNESSNTDTIGYYPAGYELPNIIAVTAINSKTKVLSSSNYSKTRVDIAAPGESINSSLPGGSFGTLTGTSQATAFVSATAALLMSHRPDVYEPEDIIHHLVQTGDWNNNLKNKVKGASRLNALYALTMAGSIMEANHQDIYEPMAQQLEDVLKNFKGATVNRAPSGDF